MIKNKMRLIYTSRLTFYVLILQIFFLLISMYAGNSGSVEAYTRLLRNDLVLWLMFVPLLLAEHRVCIFTTYYSYLSRICKKRQDGTD
ncbi:MAG: hypothetical protein LUC90_09070 [Lachnospiraceae bacterium]|nr:hypothetical protein [Lachnospiraceae bacterium]